MNQDIERIEIVDPSYIPMTIEMSSYFVIDPTVILGETNSKKIRNDLNLNPRQFQYWLSRNLPYKGCVIVEK